jgi:hypothetical protein
MIKADLLPIACGVAGSAVVPILPFVCVVLRMTRKAGLRWPLDGVALPVTPCTSRYRMSADKRETRGCMIER